MLKNIQVSTVSCSVTESVKVRQVYLDSRLEFTPPDRSVRDHPNVVRTCRVNVMGLAPSAWGLPTAGEMKHTDGLFGQPMRPDDTSELQIQKVRSQAAVDACEH